MTRALLATLAVVVLLLALLWGFQRKLVYFPAAGPVPSASTVLTGGQDVELETADGLRLGAWFVPARGSDGGFTVLVANGNGGNRSHRAALADALSARGFSVLLFDYRGYGGNPGSPAEDGLALDVRAAREHLVSARGVPDERLLYFGESLGAAVVVELAAEHPPARLLLRSPFGDLASVGREHYPLLPVGLLLRDRYPLADQLRELQVPVTVVYGSADSIVPPEQSRAVATAAPRLLDVVEVAGADHNDRALLDGDELVDAVVRLSRAAE
jgi:fermentation-respiration switch protein FrsA (DUF1100 family)